MSCKIFLVTGSLMSGSLNLADTPFSMSLIMKLSLKLGRLRHRRCALTPEKYNCIVAGASSANDRCDTNSSICCSWRSCKLIL